MSPMRATPATQDLSALSRHSGMPLAGIQFGPVLDSGQNRAGMTEGQACSWRLSAFSCFLWQKTRG